MRINIILLYFAVIVSSFCAHTARVKRKVLFRKNSKIFLRLNGKEPILRWTSVFQHGWGFRMNFDLPDTIPKLHKMYRRDIDADVNELMEKPELESSLCIMKSFATMISNVKLGEQCGVLCRISGIISKSSGRDLEFFRGAVDKLKNFDGDCPKLVYELVPYADV